MSTLRFILVTIILSLVVVSQFADAAPAPKKHRQHVKAKKSSNNNKLKAAFKKAITQPAANRNAKMNLFHSRSWPSTTNTFYHAPSMPLFLRSAAPTSLYYPSMRWSSSPYLTSSSPSSMMSNYLRRSDEFPTMTSTSPMNAVMSLGAGQTPALFDMSAFGGNGMMDSSFPTQSLWSMPEVSGASGSKSKLNLFNSFGLNDDELIGNLFSQFK